MRLAIEYGDGHVDVELPDDTTVISPDHADLLSHREPAPLTDPVAATREALATPLGTGPIADLVGKGGTVTIAFPDRVKGGAHETAHRKVTLPCCSTRSSRPAYGPRTRAWSARSGCTARTGARRSWATSAARCSTDSRQRTSSTTTPRTPTAWPISGSPGSVTPCR